MAQFDSDKIGRYCTNLPDWQLQQLGRIVASEIRKRKQQWELASYKVANPKAQPTQVKLKGGE